MKNIHLQNKITKNKSEYTQIITDNFNEIETIQTYPFFLNYIQFFQEIKLASLYVKTYYCVIYFENKPIFFSYYQFLKPNEQTVKKITESNQFSSLMQILLGISRFKVLVLGNILRNNFSSFLFLQKDITQETAHLFWLESSEILADKLKCIAIVGKEIGLESHEKDFLGQNNFFQQIPDIFMNLEINPSWHKIEDYANSLSRKYAARFKKITEQKIHFESRLLSNFDIEKYQMELQNLYLQTIEDQDFVFSQVNTSFWLAMRQIHLNNFEVFGIFSSNKLIAFFTTLETEFELEMYYLGYDKTLNLTYNLYFNMLFLGLDKAIEKNKKILKLGRSSLDAKLNLGAKRYENLFLIKLLKIKGKMLDAWMKCQWKDRAINTIERNPFKKIL